MTTTRKSRFRRGKFLLAALAVTAAFAGGTQALAPTSAGAVINNCKRFSDAGRFWDWVRCEMESEAPYPG